MADKFTKTEEPAGLEEDDWKDVRVEKEHQPAKQKSDVTYRQMENEVANIDAQTTELASRKTTIVAEMAEIKKAVEA